MSQFERYRLPLGVTKGVWIELPDTEAAIHVQLPAVSNEEFNLNMMSAYNSETVDSDPDDPVDSSVFARIKRKTFFDTCILGSRGLPDDLSPKEFFSEFGLAAKYIYEKANELASRADAEVQEAMGNLTDSSNGSGSGKVRKLPTK